MPTTEQANLKGEHNARKEAIETNFTRNGENNLNEQAKEITQTHKENTDVQQAKVNQLPADQINHYDANNAAAGAVNGALEFGEASVRSLAEMPNNVNNILDKIDITKTEKRPDSDPNSDIPL